MEIVLGGLDPQLYSDAANLRWIQFPSAGVDGSLTAEFVDSDVILTSAKGKVEGHLSEHAMALLLTLTLGIGHAVRALNWTVKMDIRNRSWELPGRVMGIVGLGGTGRELARFRVRENFYDRFQKFGLDTFPGRGRYFGTSHTAVIGDLDGDGRDELLVTDREKVWIFQRP